MPVILTVVTLSALLVMTFGVVAQFISNLRTWFAPVVIFACALNAEALVRFGPEVSVTAHTLIVALFGLLLAIGIFTALYVLGRALPVMAFADPSS